MTPREEERAAIVKWLLARVAYGASQPFWKRITLGFIMLPATVALKLAADAIEKGAHLNQDAGR